MIALLTFGVSACCVVFLPALFAYETQRGARIAEPARRVLDQVGRWFFRVYARFERATRRDAVRQTVHYFLHLVLTAAQRVMRVATEGMERLITLNRTLARKATAPRPHVSARSMSATAQRLGEIMAHKRSTALSTAERKRKKEEAIGMRMSE